MTRQRTPEQKKRNLERTQKWQKDNPDKVKASAKKYYWANREKQLAAQRKWAEANPDYAKNWREENKETHQAQIKQWGIDNAERVSANNKRWRENNKERELDTRLKHRYGISLAEKLLLIAAQGNVCAMCKYSVDENGWHVEHDHDTGEVRGMTCETCNRILSALGDNLATATETFDRVKHYLTVVATVDTPRRLAIIRGMDATKEDEKSVDAEGPVTQADETST